MSIALKLLPIIALFATVHYYMSSEIIKVHIVPHSHDDMGWLKTPKQYYYGEAQEIRLACVKDVITTVYENLVRDPTKKFIQVEMGFFRWWWDEQTDEVKENTKRLVANRQLEFINAGVCQNDEATPYYEDMIDNMVWGHQFILKNFGKEAIPTIGWQIDPFGHSQTQANIFNQIGFDGWFFARIDHQDRDNRNKLKQLELLTQTATNRSIFTHVLYNLYFAPPNFNFDRYSGDEMITYQNLLTKSYTLVQYFIEQSQYYDQNIIMHCFGEDFTYGNATKNFENIDKLVNFINEFSYLFRVELIYSTPSQYLKAINELKKEYTVKKDDFFPYADNENQYWTGYFSSRPVAKLVAKQVGRLLQNFKNLVNLLNIHQKLDQDKFKQYTNHIDDLEFVNGIFQHHDAITGTERQLVADAYNDMFSEPLSQVNKDLIEIFDRVNTENGLQNQDYQMCYLNQTYTTCSPIMNNLKSDNNITLNVYNPGMKNNFTLRVKVAQQNYQVYSENQPVETDIFCFQEDCDLYFNSMLDSYKFHTFQIVRVNNGTDNVVYPQKYEETTFKINYHSNISLSLNNQTRGFTYVNNNVTKEFDLQYGYYKAFGVDGQQNAGAYIMRTADDTQKSFLNYGITRNKANDVIYVGKVATIVQMRSQKIDSQVKFFYNPLNIEIETFVKSIDISDNIGKEIVLVVSNSKIHNNQVFYTDSNGMHFQKRKVDYRPTWDFQSTQYIAQNFYPVNAVIGVKDENEQEQGFYVLNDRSQGGTSLKNGTIQLLIHRRLLNDDSKGVDENLNETDSNGQGLQIITQHHIVFGNDDDARIKQYQLDLQPLKVLSETKKKLNKNIDSFDFKMYQFIADGKNLDMYNFNSVFDVQQQGLKFYLKYLEDNKYIFRFHNMLDTQKFQLNLTNLSVSPVQLTAVKSEAEASSRKLIWNNQTENYDEDEMYLQPQELKTFILDLDQSKFKV